jgi:hypothetical protein
MLDNDSLDEIRRRMQESLIEAKRQELREQHGMQMDNLDPACFNSSNKAGRAFGCEWPEYAACAVIYGRQEIPGALPGTTAICCG